MFELAVVVSIFAILVVVLLQKISYYQDEAEIVATRKLVADLQSALNIKVGGLLAQNRSEELAALAGQNPMELVGPKPPHYRGQFYSPAEQDVEPGSWYFDRTTKNLVYVFQNSKTFRPSVTKRIYFRVEYHGLPAIPAKHSRTLAAMPSVVLIQVDG